MEIRLSYNAQRDVVRRIEGPTRKQVTKARKRIAELKTASASAAKAENWDRAFDLDAQIFDLANEFRPYGYELDE